MVLNKNPAFAAHCQASGSLLALRGDLPHDAEEEEGHDCALGASSLGSKVQAA